MMPKAILFDAYGTLISTGNRSVSAVNRILEKNHVNLDPATFYSEWKRFHRKHMSTLPFQKERDIFALDLKQLYKYYGIKGDVQSDISFMLESLFNRVAFPETRSSLESLKQFFQVYICSNTDTLPLLQNIQYNALSVHGVFTSEKLNCYKPDPLFYQSVLDQIGLKAEEAVFIGDSYLDDIKGPKKLGIYSVLIDRKQSHMPLGEMKPDQILTSLPDAETVASWFQPAASD